MERDCRDYLANHFGKELTEQQEAALHMSFAAGALTAVRRAKAAGLKETKRQALTAFGRLEHEVNVMVAPYVLAASLNVMERPDGGERKGGSNESV